MSHVIPYIIVIIASVIGYFLNDYYSVKYNEFAVDTGSLLIQCLLIVLLMFLWPDITIWFILCCILLALVYWAAIKACIKKAESIGAEEKDKRIAVMAQCILPVAAAFLIVILLILIFGSGNNTKRRKK